MIPTQKRQRSPSVPFIGLGFAVARARQVYDRAGRAPLSRAQAADIWGLAPKTSLGHRTIAALRNYGLIEDDGATEQIRISDLVAAVFVSQEDAVWQRAFAAAALNPELIAEYAAKWGAGRPSDGVCIDDLQTNHGFTAPAAKSFLPVFDEAMWFAGGGATGVFAAVPQSVSQMPAPSSRIRIGDYVQTPSAQSPGPHRVVWLADGGRYVYVEKTFTRYPVQSVTKIEASPFHLPSSQSGEPRTTKGASATESARWVLFPNIELPRALDYTSQLGDAAGREWMSIGDAANLWLGTPDPERRRQIAEGLCDFGLAEQTGRGKSRKLRVSDLGWRVITNHDNETGLSALREAISKSTLIVHYARVWWDGIPPYPICIDRLKREQGFTENRAAQFLTVFYYCYQILQPALGDDSIDTKQEA